MDEEARRQHPTDSHMGTTTRARAPSSTQWHTCQSTTIYFYVQEDRALLATTTVEYHCNIVGRFIERSALQQISPAKHKCPDVQERRLIPDDDLAAMVWLKHKSQVEDNLRNVLYPLEALSRTRPF